MNPDIVDSWNYGIDWSKGETHVLILDAVKTFYRGRSQESEYGESNFDVKPMPNGTGRKDGREYKITYRDNFHIIHVIRFNPHTKVIGVQGQKGMPVRHFDNEELQFFDQSGITLSPIHKKQTKQEVEDWYE